MAPETKKLVFSPNKKNENQNQNPAQGVGMFDRKVAPLVPRPKRRGGEEEAEGTGAKESRVKGPWMVTSSLTKCFQSRFA